jgi:hypothetical protein
LSRYFACGPHFTSSFNPRKTFCSETIPLWTSGIITSVPRP